MTYPICFRLMRIDPFTGKKSVAFQNVTYLESIEPEKQRIHLLETANKLHSNTDILPYPSIYMVEEIA